MALYATHVNGEVDNGIPASEKQVNASVPWATRVGDTTIEPWNPNHDVVPGIPSTPVATLGMR